MAHQGIYRQGPWGIDPHQWVGLQRLLQEAHRLAQRQLVRLV
jgi:hypothetical protein